jgi:uncharacterized RDD family membrane protein YckC
MEWYYLRDGKTMGPVPEGSIRAWLESGFLLPEDLLWRAGMMQWLPVVELTEFGGSRGAEHAVGPDQEAWRGTTDDRDANIDRFSSADVEPGAQDSGSPADEGGASSAHASGSPTGSPGDPDGVAPATAGPGGSPSARGGPAGAYADTGRGHPGASPWGRARAEWSEAPAAYANIWARAGAAAIDLMLLVAAVLVVFRPELPTTGNIEEMAKLNPAMTPAFMAVAWLYFGLMEGSALQASLGKLAFGLKVTDLDGNRLLPGRALVRGLLKVVLMEITAFLSFLPAAFTSRRQALHDMVAGSTVLVR